MLPKPESCKGCPAYEWGPYYVPDKMVEGAEVLFMLQNPGEYEEKGLQVIERIGRNKYVTQPTTPQPLIGPTGYDCDKHWFPLIGQDRASVSLANTIRCRMGQGNTLPPVHSKLCAEISTFCNRVHYYPPVSTKLIVACGAYAAAYWSCPGNVTDWRGYIIPGSKPPVLVTLHPADLNHQPKMTVACISDWEKIPKILNKTWPTPLPPYRTYTGSQEDEQWFTTAMTGPYVSLDTEYVLAPPGEASSLTLIGLHSPRGAWSLSVWWSPDVIPHFLPLFRKLIASVPVVMWNAVADIPVLEQALGVTYADYYRIEDPMLLHALLWSELPHTLAFCASMDGKYEKLKHLMDTNLARYNQGDVLETSHLYEEYHAQASLDPPTRSVYESQALPLIPLLLASHRAGVRVHRAAVIDALTATRSVLSHATSLARGACGRDINLSSSQQIQAYLYTEKGYPLQKHYKTKQPTVNQDAINLLRSTHLPVDSEYEEQEGLNADYIQQRIESGGDTFLESVALYAASKNLLSTYLVGLVRGVYLGMDDKARRRARTAFNEKTPTLTDIVERVYPDKKQHAQANGRWSITDPPLAGMPKLLHHCFIPDEGQAWIKYDFKQIEPRIRACVAQDWPRLRDFEEGKDIYRSTCLEMFGRFSPTLRKLGKTVELALSYGKQPFNLHHVPGIGGYGFGKKELTHAGQNYLRAHPEQTRWMDLHTRELHRCGYSRELVAGRRRMLLGHWGDQEREGLNQPMQAGAVSLTNLTILAIANALPYVLLVNNRFDEHWWAVPQEKVEEARTTMIEILGKPWTINGITMVFPVDPPELTVIYPPEEV